MVTNLYMRVLGCIGSDNIEADNNTSNLIAIHHIFTTILRVKAFDPKGNPFFRKFGAITQAYTGYVRFLLLI